MTVITHLPKERALYEEQATSMFPKTFRYLIFKQGPKDILFFNQKDMQDKSKVAIGLTLYYDLIPFPEENDALQCVIFEA